MASSSESTEGEGAGYPPAKRQKHEETGNGNESNVTGCWIATNAYTGIPLDNQSTLDSEVKMPSHIDTSFVLVTVGLMGMRSRSNLAR